MRWLFEKKNRSRNKGMVYIMAMGMVIMFMSIAFAFQHMIREDTWLNRNYLHGMKAFYAAEAGIQHGIAELRTGNDIKGAEDLASVPSMAYGTAMALVNDDTSPFFLNGDGDGDNDYYVQWTGTFFDTTGTLVSEGEYYNAKRTITAIVTVGDDPAPRTITINNWYAHAPDGW